MAAIVCLLSFEIIKIFDYYSPSNGDKWDWISEAGDWVVCVVCIGGSMGALAWLKLWVGNASFNTGELRRGYVSLQQAVQWQQSPCSPSSSKKAAGSS